jgi:hypothetical protein
MEIDQTNEVNNTIPSMVTQKRKSRSGLKFSGEKEFKRSRLARLSAKTIGYEFIGVTKALLVLR